MQFKETDLKGVYLIHLESFTDDRGWFARTFCKKEFAQIGHTKEFVQFNHSHTQRQGTIRGLHFQKPPHAEIKLIRCIRGKVYDVIVDMRYQSPTFLQYIGVELSEQNQQMVYIPEGCAHGFQTLQDDTDLIYHHTAFYVPEQEAGIRYNDPQVHIQWPLPLTDISEKDKNHPWINPSFAGLAI